MSIDRLWSLKSVKFEKIIRCDEELIGKNSVIPCIKDKRKISIINKFLKSAIPIITDLINSAYSDIREGESFSINAPLRDLQINRTKWLNIVKNFDTRLKLMSPKEIKDYCSN